MMSVKSVIGSILLIAVLVIGLVRSEAAMPSRAAGAKILVGDVVPMCKGAACEIEVGPSPLPGRTRVVSRQDVVRALAGAGIEQGNLKIPKRRRVIRPSKKASGQELKSLIRNAVIDVLPDGITLETLGRVNDLEVPESGYQIEARWPGERSFRHRISVPVDLIADGVSFRRLQIAATLALEIRLPVAARDLARGTILDDRSVKWVDTKLNAPPTQLACSASGIIGRRLLSTVPEGEPFKEAILEKIPIVKRGQRLSVESIQGLVRIRTSGVARQDGALGDRIRIGVQSASQLLWAEVAAPGRVVVMP
ncbi:MAG: flagellar basal body P-ring formation protein FlgA [Proteobacteria bacterium]|nr:flagellar basal body P-ring formation protein FlgA [Pseudomonadota bacterium]